jgi:hypothetical protein
VQLNVHVPKERERLLGRLEAAARRSGRPKNQVVLDAIERYLEDDGAGRPGAAERIHIPVFDMGEMAPFVRADLYEERVAD